jgi:hypothetical protein
VTARSFFEDQRSPSLFEGINARYYRSPEIVRNFVANEQFENLAVRQHSLVVGPRGSGKTTLLRMLHPECLRIWKGKQAENCRKLIEFSAAYVSTDKVWRQQADSASSLLSRSEQLRFVSHVIALDVMSAIVRLLELRTTPAPAGVQNFRGVSLESRKQAILVEEVAAGWELSPKFFDFGSLRIAIRKARIYARQLAQQPAKWMDFQQLVPWDEAALLAIDAFESATGTRDEVWALLFDELEIVPPFVRDQILSATRGMDKRLLLKCSLSPWLSERSLATNEHEGTVFNDFNVIRLFYGRRSENYSFSRQLIEGKLRSAGITVKGTGPIEDLVFGPSKFSAESDVGKKSRTAAAYGSSKPLGQVVKELAERDPDFADWLKSQGISAAQSGQVSEPRRAQTLRKVRNIMISRLEFRASGGRELQGRIRSRKTMSMYAGGATMLDICEGNPRLLLGLLVPLLDYFDGAHPIPEQHQAEALGQIADDFYALIDAIPVTSDLGSIPELRAKSPRSPYRELIDRIADFFQRVTLRGRFDPQPPSTFRVPLETSEQLQFLIGRLINMGAIVIVPDRGIKDVLIGKFDQNRVRLCYLIAAREHLPPNIDRPVTIQKVLSRDVENGALDLLDEDIAVENQQSVARSRLEEGGV